jgi:NAD+ synthase (glutamine-hydrolysing)
MVYYIYRKGSGMVHGFLRVASATPVCTVGDCGANTAGILALIREASSRGVSLVVFPELSITGYTCGDLFSQELLGRVSIAAVRLIAEKTRDVPVTSIVGFPFAFGSARYNCAAVLSRGTVVGIVPKTHIPNYGEFYELRHFTPAPGETRMIPAGVFGPESVPFGTRILFADEKNQDISFAAEICEDLWVPSPPSSSHARAGALLVANLSASNEVIGKAAYRRTLVTGQSGRAVCAYIYADAGQGESSTDMVFSGHNLIAENGAILAESALFSNGLICADIDTGRLLQERRRMNTFENLPDGSGNERNGYTRVLLSLDAPGQAVPDLKLSPALIRHIDPLPFVPALSSELERRCEEVFAIQSAGLVKRLSHTGIKSAVIGLSGGLDSTLALLVTVRAFDLMGYGRGGILAITMPGFGTTKHTKSNALKLASVLGVELQEIRIDKAVKQHFSDIGQDGEKFDITYENSQARERTQILMDKANMTNGLVIGTGDLSELALGWATYNGDHMSMYGVNMSIPKTLVRHLVAYCADSPSSFIHDAGSEEGDEEKKRKQFAHVLAAVLATPVSPELLPCENGEISQKTEHIVGPYELHDFFLYYLTRWGFSPAKILFLAEQAFGADRERADGRTSTYLRSDILKWMQVFYRRFFSQQFKRSCMPDGPKVGSVTLSPRSDWRMPSDSSAAVWLKELESLGD